MPAMEPSRKKRLATLAIYAAGLLGLALAIALIVHEGAGDILHILEIAGWGLLWLVPFHLLPIGLDVVSWRYLLRGEKRANFPFLLWVAAVRESINGLLPVARVGGEVAGARLLARHGVPGYVGSASIMVEVTLTLASQFLFTLAGLGILVFAVRDNDVIMGVLIGLLVTLPALVAFVLLQHHWGFFQLLERMMTAIFGGRNLFAAIGDTARLDEEIRRLYRRRWNLSISIFWQLAGLFAGAVEVWFTFYILGHPVHLWVAVLMESLGQALRSASFIVPGGIGIQEGGFLLFGAAAGIGPELALAFSLARRFREIAFGTPVLLSWQGVEGHYLRQWWRRRAASAQNGEHGEET